MFLFNFDPMFIAQKWVWHKLLALTHFSNIWWRYSEGIGADIETTYYFLLPLLLAGSWPFQTKSQFSLSEIYEPFCLRACISKRSVIGEHTKNGVYVKGAAVDLLLAWPGFFFFFVD